MLYNDNKCSNSDAALQPPLTGPVLQQGSTQKTRLR